MSQLRQFASTLFLVLLATLTVRAADASQPWKSSDLMTPEQLNAELPAVKAGKIVLIHVGFEVMYRMGHIPGSQYAGPAANAQGLEALKKLVAKLPRNQKIVIYCGCCPWDDCPNIRPAFRALKEMGFTNFKVLNIPSRLGSDWTAKGFPTVQGE
jgi:hypothetical protein